MDGERLAARMADIDAMEARVNGAPDKEEAIIEEMIRLLDERDEARAEVRRLTAALDVVRGDLGDTNAIADGYIARLRAEHTAALATARREGAEAMRERLAAIWDARAAEHDATVDRWRERGEADLAVDYERWAQRDRAEAAAIRALPLDAPGGGS